MEQDSPIRLVAGLGNPGKTYDRTRHNIGFLVVEELCRRAGLALLPVSKWQCAVATAADIAFMKPLTFMNRSGEAVGSFARFYKIEAPSVLVVVDDVALPVGKLRIRRSGSSGGHNGLESIIAHLGTTDFPRIRVGIGAGRVVMHDHVLGKFSAEEEPEIEAAIQSAADAVKSMQTHGLNYAMNHFNQKN
jgi:PTH1 family peptidyl-tRNA hydrolase